MISADTDSTSWITFPDEGRLRGREEVKTRNFRATFRLALAATGSPGPNQAEKTERINDHREYGERTG
jgi:hypothetical protein